MNGLLQRPVKRRADPAKGMSEDFPKAKQQPIRVCLVCRGEKPRNELFRLVKMKEVAYLIPNPLGKLPGKGVYFCRDSSCIERLQKEKKLKRLFLEKLQWEGLAWMQEQLAGLSPGSIAT